MKVQNSHTSKTSPLSADQLQVTEHDFKLHTLAKGQQLTVGISGASGMIGRALSTLLTTGGHRVIHLVRRSAQSEDERSWPTPHETPELSDLDAIVHLAGESVAQRWTKKRKTRIYKSRTERTQALSQELQRLKQEGERCPEVLVCASAIGYYGDTGDQEVDERAPLGEGFLAEVCEAWERACLPASEAGVRVVRLRTGIVLSPTGGALAKLITPFKLGVGGPVGRGRQWMSWISLHDTIGAIYFSILNSSLSGPVNAVSPTPQRNIDFSKKLAKVLRRPALFPAPPFMLKMIFGEMASEMILTGQKVHPTQLIEAGYPFMHSDLEETFRFILGRAHPT